MRVLIVDGQRLNGSGLRRVLEEEDDIHVVGCATTPEQARHEAAYCDVVLVNAGNFDVAASLKLVRELVANHPSAKVIVLGVDESSDHVLAYVEAGASGFVSRADSVKRTVDKLRAAQADQAVISPSFAARLIARVAELSSQPLAPADLADKVGNCQELTRREQEVLDLIGRGMTNREIGSRLFIQEGTVKNHVHNILTKLEVSDRHAASTVYSLQHSGRHTLGVTAA